LQSGEPLLLLELLLLAPPPELLLLAPPLELELPFPPPLELLLVVPPAEVDELVEPFATVPPLPPEPSPGLPPFPPLEKFSNSPPVAHATSDKPSIENQSDFFIWAPWGPRRC
jgi:hypothetical protein